jgi:2-iminobutanoate/2-iminopropanoate deaminase
MTKVVYPAEGNHPYAKAVRAGDFLFVSGHLAWGDDGELIHGSIEQETRQVWKNIRKTLEGMDCTLEDIVKATIWLQDTRDFINYNKAYSEVFPKDPPARSTVRADLMFDCKIEVEVVVYKPTKVADRH